MGHGKKPKFTRSMFINTLPEILAEVEALSGVSSDQAIFDPEDEDYLHPEDAARMFLSNPASVGFNLMEFPYLFDIAGEDVSSEIGAGRLIAHSCSKKDQFGKTALVSGADLMAWVNNPDTPKYIRKKLKRIAGGEGVFFTRRARCVPLKTGPLR